MVMALGLNIGYFSRVGNNKNNRIIEKLTMRNSIGQHTAGITKNPNSVAWIEIDINMETL